VKAVIGFYENGLKLLSIWMVFQVFSGVVFAQELTVTPLTSGDACAYIDSFLVSSSSASACETSSHEGEHIEMRWSDEFQSPAFYFHIDLEQGDDRGMDNGRQRTEIKVFDKSEEWMQAKQGERFVYTWAFRLSDDFGVSDRFTHLFQIKAKGGDDSAPLVTLTARHLGSRGERLFIGYQQDGDSSLHKYNLQRLCKFKGRNIQAVVEVNYGDGHEGALSVSLSDMETGEVLLSWFDASMDMWRTGNDFIRPKWGIYRSKEPNNTNYDGLKDETVLFSYFSIARE